MCPTLHIADPVLLLIRVGCIQPVKPIALLAFACVPAFWQQSHVLTALQPLALPTPPAEDALQRLARRTRELEEEVARERDGRYTAQQEAELERRRRIHIESLFEQVRQQEVVVRLRLRALAEDEVGRLRWDRDRAHENAKTVLRRLHHITTAFSQVCKNAQFTLDSLQRELADAAPGVTSLITLASSQLSVPVS
jgi:hypothetical protein